MLLKEELKSTVSQKRFDASVAIYEVSEKETKRILRKLELFSVLLPHFIY